MQRALIVATCVAAAVAVLAADRGSDGVAAEGSAQAGLEFPRGRIVDLSHSFERRTVYWPTAKRFRLTKVAEGETEGGYFYAANNYEAAEHGGTHLDSPVHFARGGDYADEVPLSKVTGRAIVIDVASRALADRDYLVSVADVEAWEREHGRIARDTIVLLRTGYDRYWPDRERYMGTAERGAGAVPKLHFPGLHPDAARLLVTRRVGAVGIDTASIDYGQSTLFESHRVLGASEVPVLENVTNLRRLPAEDFLVFALPMKIARGSGGPLRAMAIVPRG